MLLVIDRRNNGRINNPNKKSRELHGIFIIFTIKINNKMKEFEELTEKSKYFLDDNEELKKMILRLSWSKLRDLIEVCRDITEI